MLGTNWINFPPQLYSVQELSEGMLFVRAPIDAYQSFVVEIARLGRPGRTRGPWKPPGLDPLDPPSNIEQMWE